MSRVRWATTAVDDLKQLREFYQEISETTATLILGRIVLATDWLLDWPFAGQAIGKSGWRKWSPRRTGYVLIYRVTDDGIEIGYVRHERENWMSDL